MRRPLSKKIADMSLMKKIIAIALINIAIISVAALAVLNIYFHANQKLLYTSLADSLSYSATELSNRLNNALTISYLAIANADLQRSLAVMKDSDDYVERSRANNSLYSRIMDYYPSFSANQIRFISLYNVSFPTHTNRILAEAIPEDVLRDLSERTRQLDGAPCWITEYTDPHGLFLGRTIKRTSNMRLDYLGDMLISIDLTAMVQSIAGATGYSDVQYLIYDKEALIFHSKGISQEDALAASHTIARNQYGVISEGSRSYFAVRGSIPRMEWEFICLAPYDEVIRSLHISRMICFGIIAAAALGALVFSAALTNNITRHIFELLSKLQRFGKDETQLPESSYDYGPRRDELGLMHRQFDNMAQKIQNLIQVNYIDELLKKEAQLKALQSQINPHFLYNTLGSVYWRAKARGEEEIASTLEALSTMLRIMLDRDDPAYTIANELELIDCFMYIQKMRYEERLEFQTSIAEKLKYARIPKLCIQPLVENAVQYGLKQVKVVCRVMLEVSRHGEGILIRVKNSGSQFEDGLMEKLTGGQIAPNGFGIGLTNINKRLKLMFGENAGIALYNSEDFAVAEITISISTLQGDMPDEDDHCG